MTYKAGDLVYFDGDGKKGVGKIVAISGNSFLVHSTQIIGGHYGTPFADKQDNDNNWYFFEEELKPFTKKVGQKYKVLSDRESSVKSGEIVTLIHDCGYSISTYKQENGRKAWLYGLEHSKCDVEFYEDVESVKENEMFTKEDLQVGYLVKLRDGKLAHVVNTAQEGMCFNFEDGWNNLNRYNDYLDHTSRDTSDVVEVYGLTEYGMYAHNFEIGKRKLLWKREEAKEMTIEEIQKALGHKIKIVE